MKKIIFVLLLCFSMLVCNSSAIASFDNKDVKKNNISKATAEKNTAKEISSTDNDIINALIEYLQQLRCDYEVPETSIEMKIDEIKNGTKPLLLDFNSSNSYFVCAYYESKISDYYRDATKYTWIRFEKSDEILEYYKDKKLVVSFQINQASLVTDILDKDAKVPNVEHFQIYIPNFDEGVNTNSLITFDETFIYLNASENDNVYHSTFTHYNYRVTIPTHYFDYQYYITIPLKVVNPDGQLINHDIVYDFGKYHNELQIIMNTEKYSVKYENGVTIFYGLIEINNFANLIV